MAKVWSLYSNRNETRSIFLSGSLHLENLILLNHYILEIFTISTEFSLILIKNKLRQLEQKQQELITDNLELKELCLYLDEERTLSRANALCSNCGATCPTVLHLRDDGDGSSSSTNADEPMSRRYSNVKI